MLLVFHKNKIISYTVAASIVAVLFIFSTLLLPNKNVEIVPASSNTINDINFNEVQNNNVKNDNTVKRGK